jgi:hypothetical protein
LFVSLAITRTQKWDLKALQQHKGELEKAL